QRKGKSMSQRARPAEDVSTGNWTPTPLFEHIKEEVPDTDAVASADDPNGDSFTVKVQQLAPPNTRCPEGSPRLTVRLKKSGPCPAQAVITLLQGGTVIASEQVEPSEDYQDFVLDLTTQFASITDFRDLRLKVTAFASCSTVHVPCCDNVLSQTLFITFTGDL